MPLGVGLVMLAVLAVLPLTAWGQQEKPYMTVEAMLGRCAVNVETLRTQLVAQAANSDEVLKWVLDNWVPQKSEPK